MARSSAQAPTGRREQARTGLSGLTGLTGPLGTSHTTPEKAAGVPESASASLQGGCAKSVVVKESNALNSAGTKQAIHNHQ